MAERQNETHLNFGHGVESVDKSVLVNASQRGRRARRGRRGRGGPGTTRRAEQQPAAGDVRRRGRDGRLRPRRGHRGQHCGRLVGFCRRRQQGARRRRRRIGQLIVMIVIAAAVTVAACFSTPVDLLLLELGMFCYLKVVES